MPGQLPHNIEIRTPEERERALQYMARHKRKNSNTGSDQSSNHQGSVKEIPQTAAVVYPDLKESSDSRVVNLRRSNRLAQNSSTKDLNIPTDSGCTGSRATSSLSGRSLPDTQALGPRGKSEMLGGISGGVVNLNINNGTIINGKTRSSFDATTSAAGRATVLLKSGFLTMFWSLNAFWRMVKSPIGRGVLTFVAFWMWLRPCDYGYMRDMPLCQVSVNSVACQWLPSALFCKPAVYTQSPTSDTTFLRYGRETFSSNAQENPSEIMHLVCRTVREHHHNITKRHNIPGHQDIELEILRLAWLINNTQSLQMEYQLKSYSVWAKIDQQIGPIAATLNKLLIEDKTFASTIWSWLNPLLDYIGFGTEYYQDKYRQTLTAKLIGIKVQLEEELLPLGREVVEGNKAVDDQFYVVRSVSERGKTELRNRYDSQNSWTGWIMAGFSSEPAKATRGDMEALTVIVDSSVQHANRLSDLGLVHTTKVRTVMTSGSYLNQEKFESLDHDEFARMIKEWAEFAKGQVSAARRDTYNQPRPVTTIKASY